MVTNRAGRTLINFVYRSQRSNYYARPPEGASHNRGTEDSAEQL